MGRRSARRRSGERGCSDDALIYTALRGERILPRFGMGKTRAGQRVGRPANANWNQGQGERIGYGSDPW